MFDERPWKLVTETEWTRVYKDGDATLCDSKFFRDGLEVGAESIKGRWSSLSPHEKLDFAQAFSAKRNVTSEDENILDFLMEVGEPYIWTTITTPLRRHRDKERVLAFLLERIREDGEHKANFFEAIGLMRDNRAVPALRAAYDNYRKELRAGAEAHVGFDHFSYLSCCTALWEIEGPTEYRKAIEELSRSDDKAVRSFAELILRGDHGKSEPAGAKPAF
jgi:hypothetical protein